MEVNEYPPVLLVEPDDAFAHLLTTRIEQVLGCEVVRAINLVEGLQLVSTTPDRFLLALVEPCLPDAPSGEIVDHLLGLRIPVILFSQAFEEGDREDILSKGVVDYVLKSGTYNLEYVVRLVERIRKNRFIHVLIVDDSRSARIHFRNLLERRLFQVQDAPSGEVALQVLDGNPRIKMVLVDYQMSGMNGFQLIQRIRESRTEEDLVIIGISAYGNNILSAKFLKYGANDFICKPFLVEEFFCRIDHCIHDLETLNALKYVYLRDFLTGLYNRFYLFEVGAQWLARPEQAKTTLHAIMVGVDQMKWINATFGYAIGDTVIRAVARILAGQFQETDVVTRIGGAEFCLLVAAVSGEMLADKLQQACGRVEARSMRVAGQEVRCTISCGVQVVTAGDSVNDLVQAASALHDQAMSAGGNRVVWSNAISVQGSDQGSV